MDRRKLFGILMLFLAALLWGTSFVAQDVAAEAVQGFTFQAVRCLLGAVVLLVVCISRDLLAKKSGTYRVASATEQKALWLGGIGCGTLLCVATVLQQFGIGNNATSPGKDAFITALYIVFVPVFSLFLGKLSQPHVYVCVLVALVGLWLLCMGGSGITVGDIQVILCSVAFSFHIMLVGHVAPRVDGIKLSCIQFFVAGTLAAVGMFIFERPDPRAILSIWFPLVYAGVFSAAGGFTFQIIGQKYTPPTLACLVMSLESVIAVLTSMILQPELSASTLREWIGMALIFVAIVVSQIPLKYRKRGINKQERS